jgi:hypothetical protein
MFCIGRANQVICVGVHSEFDCCVKIAEEKDMENLPCVSIDNTTSNHGAILIPDMENQYLRFLLDKYRTNSCVYDTQAARAVVQNVIELFDLFGS